MRVGGTWRELIEALLDDVDAEMEEVVDE